MARAIPNPKKILVRLPNWVGDVVMATPALRALGAAHPDAELVVEGRPYSRPLVEDLPYVSRFIADPGKGLAKTRARVRALKAEGFDWAVLMPDSQRAAYAPWRAGIPVRIGYSRDIARELMTTHRLRHPKTPDGKRLAFSMIERYLRITRMLGCADQGDTMDLLVRDEWRAEIAEILAGIGLSRAPSADERLCVVICGASFGSSKMWPAEHFGAACDGLRRSLGLVPLVSHAPGEEGVADAVRRSAEDGVHVLAGLHLGLLAALLERTTLVLTNDTGPRSMAVALGIPCVVLMGPTHSGHTDHHLARQRVLREAVDCAPCALKKCPIDHRCMTRLRPERAVGAARELLESLALP
ncbi:MAG: lipopolysaccharide heptosyltransferase II [Planctomycetota bacterium]